MLRPLASLVVGVAVLGAMAQVHPLIQRELDCSGGGRLCPRVPTVEGRDEALQIYNTREQRLGGMPTGAVLRAAYERKQAMAGAKDEVAGANGTWRAYGRGTLITSGLVQELGAGLGQPVPDLNFGSDSGRVDNFAYDPVAKRLFAAVGTGGIWMSEARDGQVSTLGDLWVSIGDNLPTQANGAVLWTSAGGGTVVSAGGDSVMSTGAYSGLGAYWSNDLGATWTRAEGFPDGALVFNAETDPGNPRILYIASSLGLYRSEDAGRSFANVALPTTPECAGKVEFNTPCNLANVVSDVVVKHPGGTENFQCSFNGCPVLAAVGWRGGRNFYPDGVTPQSPANGLYRSETGAPGSFVRVDAAPVDSVTEMGFAPAERIGRVEMGAATGPMQDHNYVYALVHDAVIQAGGDVLLDGPLASLGAVPIATAMNGLYVSPDFGMTWARMADSVEIGTIPGPFVALIAPGQQGFYNQWVEVDPTRAIPAAGIPTRIAFGLEELFTNQVPHLPLNGIAQNTPQDFKNIGFYFSAVGADPNTHADQHAGLFIPQGLVPAGAEAADGVCAFAGNDGGVYRQCLAPGEELDNAKWVPVNNGFFTLLPYGLGVAKDGTVWFGLQDNGSGHVEPETGLYYGDFGGDGFFAEVNPDNSDIAFTETPNGGLVRTVDRGASSTDIAPPFTRPNFSNWFQMDPTDPEHMITTANQIYVTTEASTVTSSTWTEVYSLGVNPRGEVPFTAAVADVHGAAIYVGACGDCGITVNDTGFQNRIATNVGGDQPPVKGGFEGWHDATAKGLPNRFITAIEIDPDHPETVYVGLGDYQSPYRGPGSFGDPNDPAGIGEGNIYKSTDAGESFVNVSGDLPAVPVTTILMRNGQLLIGTDLGMFISEDGSGDKWAPMGNGLPNVPVTMAKLQPGNPDRVFIATFGRGIWTYDFPPEAAAKVDAGRFGGALPALSVLLLALAACRRRLPR